MDPKEMLKRYTQEYALDEPTRIKAEELYREATAKSPIVSAQNISSIYSYDIWCFVSLTRRCSS